MNIKGYYLTALMLLAYTFAFVQDETKFKPFIIFNEFTMSVNRADVENESTVNKTGFGLGVYRSWRDSSWFNLLTGISYNQTRQIVGQITLNHFEQYLDATFTLHSVSVPFLMRFNFGKSTKFFVETGVFLQVTPRGICKGKRYYDSPYDNKLPEIKMVKENGVSGSNVGGLLGLGTIIPVNKYGILAKVGYQYAFPGYEIGHVTIRNFFWSASLGFRLK